MNYLIITILVVVLGALGFWGYLEQPGSQSDTVIVDLTTPNPEIPEKDEVESILNLEQNLWKERKIRLVSITDVDYSKTVELNIEGAHPWLKSERIRKYKMSQAQDSVINVISKYSSDTSGREHSSILHVIVRELNLLADVESGEKSLTAYTDLLENSDVFKVYGKDGNESLKVIPLDSIVSIIENSVEIHDLTGIEVFLIYTPKDQVENVRYRNMSEAYREVLEGHGAKVYVGSNR